MERIKAILSAIDHARNALRLAMLSGNYETQNEVLKQISNLQRMLEDIQRENVA